MDFAGSTKQGTLTPTLRVLKFSKAVRSVLKAFRTFTASSSFCVTLGKHVNRLHDKFSCEKVWFDNITTFIERFTKSVCLIVSRTTDTVLVIASCLFKNIFRLH